jgi:hypothetical protein
VDAPVLSIVIPVRNDAARLAACLRRIRESAPADVPIEILVADNGSTDASAWVAERAGAIVLRRAGQPVGALRNGPAAVARGDLLAFIDADHEIAREWIPAALAAMGDPSVAAAGAPYLPPSPATWVQRSYNGLRRHPARPEPVEWLGSGNLVVRRAVFESVGGFDVTLETCEDVDLCRKLRAGGRTLLADPRLKTVHHGDPRTLGQVFFGELWRGRDNVRVSLRPPLSGATLVSAAIPLASLSAVTLVLAGLIAGTPTGLRLATVSLAFLLALVTLRTWVIVRRLSTGGWLRALAVAAAYEAGRALALTGLFGYGRRRPAASV